MQSAKLAQCFLLAAIAGGAAAASQQRAAQDTSTDTHSLVPRGQPSQASDESTLRTQLKLNPSSPGLLYQLALVERLNREYDESLQTYTEAAKLQEPNAMQLRSVAFDYVELNDFDDALRWLQLAAKMEPRNVDVLYEMGRCLYTKNLFSEAESTYLRVLQIAPRHLRAEENLGLTYEGEDKPEQAENALRTAVKWADERRTSDPWPYLNLGDFLVEHSRAQEAIPVLKIAVSLAGNSAFSHERLGRALGLTGDRQGAVRELEAAVELDPQNAKTHFELGRVYREAGSPEKARDEFEKSNVLYGTRSNN